MGYVLRQNFLKTKFTKARYRNFAIEYSVEFWSSSSQHNSLLVRYTNSKSDGLFHSKIVLRCQQNVKKKEKEKNEG